MEEEELVVAESGASAVVMGGAIAMVEGGAQESNAVVEKEGSIPVVVRCT